MTPSPRLVRQGRLFARLAGLCLVGTALIDGAQVLTMALRLGDVAGLSNGGFAFVVPLPMLPDDAAGAPAFVPISHYGVAQSMLATLLLALRLAPGLVLLWNLMSLFGMYARGEVFTTRNERHIAMIAWSLIAYACVPLVTHASLFAAGMSAVAIKLEVRQFDAAVAGIILFAVARVVSFGCAIDEDREGFV